MISVVSKGGSNHVRAQSIVVIVGFERIYLGVDHVNEDIGQTKSKENKDRDLANTPSPGIVHKVLSMKIATDTVASFDPFFVVEFVDQWRNEIVLAIVAVVIFGVVSVDGIVHSKIVCRRERGTHE